MPTASAVDSASVRSPVGVEVAWACTCRSSSGPGPAAARASRIARTCPSRWPAVMWCASEVTPAPASTACTRAARAAAKPARSRTTSADPSRGSSLRVECALAWANPAGGSGWMHASAPPATTTSARPSRIGSRPMAMASAPGTELDADPGRRPVRHQHRHGVRRDLADPGRLQDVVLPEHAQRTARTRTDHHGQPLRLHLRPPRVGPRLPGRDQRHLLAPVQPPRLHPVHDPGRFDPQPPRDPHRQRGRPLLLDRTDPGLPGQHRGPGRGNVPAEGRRGTQPRHQHRRGRGRTRRRPRPAAPESASTPRHRPLEHRLMAAEAVVREGAHELPDRLVTHRPDQRREVAAQAPRVGRLEPEADGDLHRTVRHGSGYAGYLAGSAAPGPTPPGARRRTGCGSPPASPPARAGP
uniref:Uncharacterized protein n=1 Tax=Streptomyces lavendulae TaxID=1914 RepID=B0CN05_STRLA|nr:hypothetical protein [Streptomyces lavendulae]